LDVNESPKKQKILSKDEEEEEESSSDNAAIPLGPGDVNIFHIIINF
jgi:hypothetical protein